MPLRPWNAIPIHESGEGLLPLPPELLRMDPHPYVAVGAPYGDSGSPFRLRQGVVERLLVAQRQLRLLRPGWRLAIFDAWRPLAVQRFMVEHAIREECAARGIDPSSDPAGVRAVEQAVARFWAPPSDDPAAPPPHSTGAAVDLTLVEQDGSPVDMGSAIDAIGAVSEPDHFRRLAASLPEGDERRLADARHTHRSLLREVMTGAGFAGHPGEWWHFSWGDQLWAWRTGEAWARYGRWLGE
jgi:D-alanyl-D-alanine dipeptidase